MSEIKRLLPRPARRGSRRHRACSQSDSGIVTAEVALALPALVIVVAALITVVVAVAAQLRCVAAAREGARAAARGETAAVVQDLAHRAAPEGAAVSVNGGGDTVTVVVTASVRPLGIQMAQIEVSGEATALKEPGTEDAAAAAFPLLLTVPLLRRATARSDPRRRNEPRRRCLGRPRDLGRSRRWLSEQGSGTVYAVAMIGVLAVLAGGATLVAKAHVAYQRAAAAADLGALAGARALVDGTGDPCSAAAHIVQRNGAQLAGCAIEGETIVISSTVSVSLGGLGLKDATARARAGPVPE